MNPAPNAPDNTETAPDCAERAELAKKIACGDYSDEQIGRWLQRQFQARGEEYARDLGERIAVERLRNSPNGLESGMDRARAALAESLLMNYSELERAHWFKRWPPDCADFVADMRRRVADVRARGLIKAKGAIDHKAYTRNG